ncbi:hypothetical protein [Lysobacter fragariae]
MQEPSPTHNPLAPPGTAYGVNIEPVRPTYGPLVQSCAAYGINRTRAYQYAKDGLIDTFTLGVKRYVFFASLDSLPKRMAAAAAIDAMTPPCALPRDEVPDAGAG